MLASCLNSSKVKFLSNYKQCLRSHLMGQITLIGCFSKLEYGEQDKNGRTHVNAYRHERGEGLPLYGMRDEHCHWLAFRFTFMNGVIAWHRHRKYDNMRWQPTQDVCWWKLFGVMLVCMRIWSHHLERTSIWHILYDISFKLANFDVQ